MGEFVGVHLTETLIDHLDIDSIILHMDTEEARLQMMEQKQREAIVGEKSNLYNIFSRETDTRIITNVRV